MKRTIHRHCKNCDSELKLGENVKVYQMFSHWFCTDCGQKYNGHGKMMS